MVVLEGRVDDVKVDGDSLAMVGNHGKAGKGAYGNTRW